MNKIKIIIKREYLTRVSKKSFLVMTILGPILMSLLIFTPFFLSNIEEDRLNIMVVDLLALMKTIAFIYSRINLKPPTKLSLSILTT